MANSIDCWWKLAMAVFFVVVVAGGGIMLWTGDATETRGINLLVVGVLGLVISILGAWISRR